MISLVPSDSPILRQPCREVRTAEVPELCDPKFLYRVDKFRKQQGGIGLAAPQIGDSRQWFVWTSPKTRTGPAGLVINPKVTFRSGATETFEEGCLSFPGQRMVVARPVEVEVDYINESGVSLRQRLHYIAARVFLHEFEHLQGICIVPSSSSL